MSAPNFAIPTASRIYAFGMNKYIDQDTIDANNYPQELLGQYDEILSQCDYDDAIANVQSELSAKGWNDIDESDRDRSYPTHYFSRIRHYFTMCGIDFTIIVDAGATSAYYEGANFDYRASLEVHLPDEWYNSEYDLTGSNAVTAAECITDNWTGNQGLSKIHAAKSSPAFIRNWLPSPTRPRMPSASSASTSCCVVVSSLMARLFMAQPSAHAGR